MDALIFDFDGVVIDSEPIHLDCFRRTLRRFDVRLSDREYYREYIGFDDHDCFAAVLDANGVPYTEQLLAELTEEKSAMIRRAYAESIEALPGAVELIRRLASAGLPLGLCSGALRAEIELAARTIGVLECFDVIISADDVSRGKPDPEGYRRTLDELSVAAGRTLDPARCLVFEDAPAGLRAARAVGMKTVAVVGSYPHDALTEADRVVGSLTEVDTGLLETLTS